MITVVRWWIVCLYAVMGWTLCHDGTSSGDFVAMVTVGAIALIAIFSAGWVYAAYRPCPKCGTPVSREPGTEHACR